MVSKVATIGLLAFLVIALVGGSAYILLRPDYAVTARGEAGPGGAGQNRGGQNREQAEPGQQERGFRGGELDQGETDRGQGRNGSGVGGAGQGRQGGREVLSDGVADHPIETWLTLSGRVAELTQDELIVQTSEGTVTMHLGPEWYWESAGIRLQADDEVEVSGFYEGDAFEVARVDNLTTELGVTLRDDTGRPMWAGRGRGGQGGAAGG